MAEPSSADDMLDVRGAAALTGRNPETIRRWVWSGRLAAHRQGRRLLVARADVEALTRRTTLSSWAERARALREARPTSEPRGSAADLVIEDRAVRAKLSDPDAGD